MRRSVEIQPCSNRFVSIGSSFFHWGASSLSYRLRRSSGPVWSSFHTSPIRGLCLNRRGPRFYVRAFQDLDRIDRDLGFLPSARPEVFGPRIISFHTAPDSHLVKSWLPPPFKGSWGGANCLSRAKRGQGGLEPPTSRTRSENHTSRPLAHAEMTSDGAAPTRPKLFPLGKNKNQYSGPGSNRGPTAC